MAAGNRHAVSSVRTTPRQIPTVVPGTSIRATPMPSNLDLAISELFLSLLFGVAEGCNLWVTEGRAWHHHVVTQFLGFCTSDGFCRNNALSLSNVCELQLRMRWHLHGVQHSGCRIRRSFAGV